MAHGPQGTVKDFSYATDVAASGEILVLASRVNTDKIHDGVDLRGLRLAKDIFEVVQRHRSLETISLVGSSIEGLYGCYAVAHLFDRRAERLADWVADKLVIVASSNLGVRQFGVYRFFQGMIPIAHPLLFHRARQLFLCDDGCLLERMTLDSAVSSGWFLSSLRAFRSRMLYANVRNDFMVNYGSPALDAYVK
ncbi:hypothetical protein BWQ96_01965 [Gracilariopsis chorda]|uniref:DUF676 domain-containing protein n=1 Tax=Gracilariopsis chorda TaxID=448386 RepID=A0A2V3J1I3_9FLOR|nr:hypothetical protein BWQ96_01965 [Gracilariopsis chorda]|eukprot:PXF48276.1 hypothetical protein BWQ96_01965 [Gracilariopsis chorda]